MDTTEFSASAGPHAAEQDRAHERLLDAAREALAWFRRLERHAPSEAGETFGGEVRVKRRLAEAVRLASFEVRGCAECDGGTIPGPTAHPMERPEPVPCASCGGSGRVRVFSYGGPGPRDRR